MQVIAIVGNTNAGKSTLFNALTRSRSALVAEYAGLTRDRQYGVFRAGSSDYSIIDTGAIRPEEQIQITNAIENQTRQAIEEADLIIFLTDGKSGISEEDSLWAQRLRRTGKPILVAVNKTEGKQASQAVADFYSLGLGSPCAISALHRHGLERLTNEISRLLPHEMVMEPAVSSTDQADPQDQAMEIALIGRPNVGKSTLLNRLAAEERSISHEAPGTTRDSIRMAIEFRDRRYFLTDTAGIRRRARINEKIEHFSIAKSVEALSVARLAILLIDAHENLNEQDLRLLDLTLSKGKAVVLAVNKWDGMSADQRYQVHQQLDRRLAFAPYIKPVFISALHGGGLGELFDAIGRAYESAQQHFPTGELNRVLQSATERHAHPLVYRRPVKLRYVHQIDHFPPTLLIHGSRTHRLKPTYQRYLENTFRSAFALEGTPLRIEFRNVNTPRNERSKARSSNIKS